VKRFLARFDWIMLLCAAGLVAFGVVFVRSAGEARAAASLQVLWQAHAVTAVTGLGLCLLLAAVDYRRLLDWGAWPFYLVSLVLLVAVLLFGAKIYGGRRWLWFFQPSEIAKPAVILLFAQIFGRADAPRGFRGFLLAGALAGVPALLILAEPDLGTALVLVPTVLAMLFAARVWTKGLAALALTAVLGVFALVATVSFIQFKTDAERRDALFAKLPLHEHQIERLRTFVDPDSDPYGAGWTLRQARISIGTGSLLGKGVGRGEQKKLGYLPPSISMNDFIFAVIAEERGFAGALAVLLLFAGLVGCGLRTAAQARDARGQLIAVGISTLLFSHAFQNIGMSIGLVPITGIPLPFISAGRTFLVVATASLGIVQSIRIHKEKPQ